MCDDDLQPLMRFVASEDGLDLAETIATALGLPFDRQAVSVQAETLHEVMFADLAKSLGLDTGALEFRSGVYVRSRAFAGMSRAGVPNIVLDLVFDFWIFALGHIMVVMGTVELSGEAVGRLHRVLDDVFSLLVDNHRFTRLRESVRPLMLEYPDRVDLSHALARSMSVSVMCHELAHIHLGHLGRSAAMEDEFEADALGCEYFLRHVGNENARLSSTVYVDPKIAAAPVLLLRIFDLYEAWRGKRGGGGRTSSLHPASAERADRLEVVLRPHLGEHALHILDGMSAALRDLKAAF
ncbi:hypothetical protein [Bosea sp. (in: a-proteobacteria)]|uniref:hypothetical protein n=1 Tax=Bosea sp. (in: a-proteobacteria) TaxID=1871050 RepID=UPI004034CE67